MNERRAQAAFRADEALQPVITGINGGQGVGDGIALALMNEHPTLSGQLAKWVAVGIVRRSLRDEDWKPFDAVLAPGKRICVVNGSKSFDAPLFEHPEHDGRHSCELVCGAILMARQFYV